MSVLRGTSRGGSIGRRSLRGGGVRGGRESGLVCNDGGGGGGLEDECMCIYMCMLRSCHHGAELVPKDQNSTLCF